MLCKQIFIFHHILCLYNCRVIKSNNPTANTKLNLTEHIQCFHGKFIIFSVYIHMSVLIMTLFLACRHYYDRSRLTKQTVSIITNLGMSFLNILILYIFRLTCPASHWPMFASDWSAPAHTASRDCFESHHL